MKRITIVILLLCTTVGYSQEKKDSTKKEYSWGVNIDRKQSIKLMSSMSDYSPLSLMATLSNEKHQFEFGPQFYLKVPSFRKMYGIGLNYKYYPRGHSKSFNSYFFGSLSYMHGNYNWSETKFDLATNAYYDGLMKVRYGSGVARVGYGLEIKVHNKFYVGMEFGVSSVLGRDAVDVKFPTNSTLNYRNIYQSASVNGFVGVTLGYRF